MENRMNNKGKFNAIDFAFYNSSGVYDFPTQCEMMKDIGYTGMIFSAWDGSRWQTTGILADVKEKYGIEIAGVYIVLNLALGEDHPKNKGILSMLSRLEGCTTINLSIQTAGMGLQNGEDSGYPYVKEWLKKALDICEQRNIDLLLYTHIGFWMNKHSIAVQLCKEINHTRLGIVFMGFHWYAGEGGNPAPVLASVFPFLKQVHLTGSTRSPLGFGGVAFHQPLDSGECDNFSIMAILKKMGYMGRFGYHGWEEGGNPYNKLKRSFDALSEMEILIDKHPSWGVHHLM